MTPYILLIIYIIFLSFIMASAYDDKKRDGVLLFAVMGLYLLFALKSTSVGRDTLGYERMYNSFFSASWSNYDLYWTEWGYETLEMIFIHIFKFSFHQFSATVYAIVCFSYYRFWKRYSNDPIFSLIIFICFGSFVFDLSGIRNALALAIYLFAIPYVEEKGFRNTVKYFLVILIAAQIHSSAYVGVLFYFVFRLTISKLAYVLGSIIMLLAKPMISSMLKLVTAKELSATTQIGGNLIFYILVFLLPFVFGLVQKEYNIDPDYDADFLEYYYKSIAMPMKALYFAILLLLITGENTINRVAFYGLEFVPILLPNAIEQLNRSSKTLAKFALYLFFFVYFWVFKLSVNDLDMLPYVFLWK